MASVEKVALDNYSEIFEGVYDDIEENFLAYKKGIKDINQWLRRPNEELQKKESERDPDKIKCMYAYLPDKQVEFIELQSEISSRLDAIFPVTKDINEISAVGTKSFESTVQVVAEGEQNRPLSSIVGMQPRQQGRMSGFTNMFRRPVTSNLPKSIEDFHIRSENWKAEIMNVPNIWGKYLNYHHNGVDWQLVFDGDGMEYYLENEINYLNSRIEPNISKIIRRAMQLTKKDYIKELAEIYVGTLKTDQAIEMQKAMSGQFSQTS